MQNTDEKNQLFPFKKDDQMLKGQFKDKETKQNKLGSFLDFFF